MAWGCLYASQAGMLVEKEWVVKETLTGPKESVRKYDRPSELRIELAVPHTILLENMTNVMAHIKLSFEPKKNRVYRRML
jgi:hypothetical protein